VTLSVLLLPKYASPVRVNVTRTYGDDDNDAKQHVQTTNSSEQRPFLCNLFTIHHMPLPGKSEIEPTLRCVMDDGRAVSVDDIPDKFFDGLEHSARNGTTRVSVLGTGITTRASVVAPSSSSGGGRGRGRGRGMTQQEVINMTAGFGAILSNTERYNTANYIDPEIEISLAIIRVTDSVGNSPSKAAGEISDTIFGIVSG